MRNKDLKKLLKAEAEKVEVKDLTNEIIKNTNHQIKYQVAPQKRHFNWGLALTLACSFVLLLVVALVPSKIISEEKEDPTDDITVEPPKPVLNKVKFEKAYDQSALSGIGLLETSFVTTSINLCSLNLYKNQNLNLTDALKGELINNLIIAKSTLNGGFEKSEEVKSDLLEYDFMYTLKGVDLNNQEILYKFYYKETLKQEDNEEEEDDEDEEDELETSEIETSEIELDSELLNEEEIETSIEGIVIYKGITYKMSGSKNIEQDEESYEYKVSIDSKNYVLIEQEMEKEETEFNYTKYENGVCVMETEVEYEVNEKGEIKLGFTTKVDGKELEYSYKYINKDDKTYIEVEFENGNEEELKTYMEEVWVDGKESYLFHDKI